MSERRISHLFSEAQVKLNKTWTNRKANIVLDKYINLCQK